MIIERFVFAIWPHFIKVLIFFVLNYFFYCFDVLISSITFKKYIYIILIIF